MRLLVIGGALTKKDLIKVFLGPTSLAEVHQRTGAIRDSIGTQKSEENVWGTAKAGVQWVNPC